MTVLSVDLASRRYADNGIALLRESAAGISAITLQASGLGLQGEPDAERMAEALVRLAAREGVRVMVLDGPQGWRANHSALVHQRVCERETRTPGKTGVPGVVKPASWTRMALFSVRLFDALAARGWPRLTDRWQGEPVAIESFPTHAWRMLGHEPLPGKSATRSIAPWVTALARHGVQTDATVTHDEVQALVAGLGGLALLRGGLAACDLRGQNPTIEGGVVREGFILSPRS